MNISRQQSTIATIDANQRACRWMPLRSLYFLYYIYCRRQQRHPEGLRDPTFTAWNAMTFALGWPIGAVLLLIDHFVGFRPLLARGWTLIHLPGDVIDAGLYSFLAILIIFDLLICKLLFGGKYQRIMQEFSIYNRSTHTIAPGTLALIGMAALAMLALLATKQPIKANLIIASIIIFYEFVFRLWWRWWSTRRP